MTYSIKNWLFLFLLILTSTACQENNPISQKQKNNSLQQPLFTSLPSTKTGVDFKNEIPESSAMNSMVYEYFYNGGGVAVGDIDNDGLPDLYFISNLKDNKLYKNKGDFKFEDITQKAKVKGGFGWSTGVTMADVNADGWLDIYVSKSGKGKAANRTNELYINNKNNTFTESAAQYQLDFSGYSTQAAFFDYDKDGDLDLFLLNHNVTPVNTNNPENFKPKIDKNVGDKLYKNENGKFVDISLQAGILGNPLGFGLGVSLGDLNNDGWADIYVSNDYIEHDYLYLNEGDGTFSEQSKATLKHTSNFSMGTDIADFNNDGWADIITLDMVAEDNYSIKTSMSGMNPAVFNHAVDNGFQHQYMFNALQLNNGISNDNNKKTPLFGEMAHLAGISNTDWSWAPLFADFDNDGWKDLFVSNGLKRDFRNNDYRKYKLERLKDAQQSKEKMPKVMEALVAKTPQRKTTNYFFKNNKDLTFSKKSREWGMLTTSFSNGAAYADLDKDGDLDLVVNNIDEPAYILQNNATQNYLQFELKGASTNPFGIGTKVSIQSENAFQVLENYPTRGYQSSVESLLHFGLGTIKEVQKVEITWSDGKQRTLTNISANQRIQLDYQKASHPTDQMINSTSSSVFKDITASSGLKHQHIENEYDDFKKESLLPHKMSQLGPALAVGDFNGDGWEDFFIGGATGYEAALYLQQADGTFQSSNFMIWEQEKKYEDVAATFFDVDMDGDLDLYVVSGGNEFPVGSKWLQDRLYLNDGKKNLIRNNKLLPKMLTSGACVKPFDFDKDGDVDLFIGGRLLSGKYPFPTNSYLLKNEGGILQNVTEKIAPELTNLGMVTDAIWTDYNTDGQIDLLVVGEWMPISFFENEQGNFKKETSLIKEINGTLNGWWSSVKGFDFDKDGDTDYLVGNLGLNYKYQASESEPFEVYANDFDKNGSLDIVLGYHNQGDLFPLRGRECTSNQMPFIKEKFPTYHDFGSANLSQVYGEEALQNALHLKVNTFASILLENNGNGSFDFSPLPNQAQMSSINAFLVNDWDGDGRAEIISAGNLYQSEIETPRNDASVGLLMDISSEKEIIPIPAFESGLFLDGDVKKMASIKLANKTSTTAAFLVGNNNGKVQLIYK